MTVAIIAQASDGACVVDRVCSWDCLLFMINWGNPNGDDSLAISLSSAGQRVKPDPLMSAHACVFTRWADELFSESSAITNRRP